MFFCFLNVNILLLAFSSKQDFGWFMINSDKSPLSIAIYTLNMRNTLNISNLNKEKNTYLATIWSGASQLYELIP